MARTGLALLLIVGLLASTASGEEKDKGRAQVAPVLSGSVLWHVQYGEFTSARAELAALSSEEREVHTKSLEELSYVATLVDLAENSANSGYRAEVEALVEHLGKFDLTSASTAYREGLARRVHRLQWRLRESDAPLARASLALAKELRGEGDLDGANAIYKGLLEQPAHHMPDTIEEARRGSELVWRAKSPWQHELVSAKSALATLGVWAIGFAAAWLLFKLIRTVLNCFPKNTPSIEIEDSEADKGRLSTREVVERLLASEQPGEGPAIDVIEDLDRSGLSNIELRTHDFEKLKDIASSTERISVAGFSFTPQQLYAVLLPLQRPFFRHYTGSLAKSGDRYRLTLRLRHGRTVTWFTCEAGTRGEVLAEGADRIAFDCAPWQVSRKWQSFRAYRKALRLLQAIGDPANMESWGKVRELLEEALSLDPDNVAARYRLGVLLRRVGMNGDASGQLERLDQTLSERNPPPWLGAFLKRNPEFKPSVRYDLALCFAKQDSFETLKRAEGLLRTLEGATCAPQRFSMLARGALAAVFAGRLGLEGRQQNDKNRASWRSGRGQGLLAEIVSRREQLQAFRADPQLEDPRACSAALAVGLAAEGRAHYLLSDREAAEFALRAARTENPGLACAVINLAQVIVKESKDPDIIDEAIELLNRGIKLSPRNAKAYYLLGHIHQFKRGDSETAAKLLQKARTYGTTAKTDLVYAEVLLKLARHTEALEVLRQSMRSMEDPIDYRYQCFLHILSDQSSRSPDLIEVANRCFRRIEKSLPSSRMYTTCADYMVQMRLRTVSELAAAQPRADVQS